MEKPERKQVGLLIQKQQTMPIERITQRRAYYLSRRVKKVTALKGGFTRLIREAHVYSNTVSNAVKGKCLKMSNAVKLEAYLDEQNVKPLSEAYLSKND